MNDFSYANPRDPEHLQSYLEYIHGIACRTYMADTACSAWVEAFDPEALDRVTHFPFFTPEGEII